MSGDQDERAAQVRHETHAGRDAYASARDLTIIHQYQRLLAEGAALEALSARSGAELLGELSANEATFNDAAFLLAAASVQRAAEALKVLLAEDEDLVISLLARLNPVRAQELIGAVTSGAAWLEQLPGAAEAVTQCEIGMRPVLGRRVGQLTHSSPSPRGTQGYRQDYSNGAIYWSIRGSAQAIPDPLTKYHSTLGGSGGRLGFPLSPVHSIQPSAYGVKGIRQHFEALSDYGQEACDHLGVRCGGSLYWSGEYGGHPTWGGIGEFYELNQGANGWLGFPVDDEVAAGPSHRDSGCGTTGWRQRFEGGVVYYSDETGAFAVPSPVADYLDGMGGVASRTGFPVSQETTAPDSPYGTSGNFQRFEGAWDYPKDILAGRPDQERPYGATIYTSAAYGTYCVAGGNGVLHERLGGTAGWLGFPKTDEIDARRSQDEPWRSIQEFEGGSIFYTKEHDSIAVSLPILEYLAEHAGLQQYLGFPVSTEKALGTENDERIQFFERGIVTIRDGVTESWVRPQLHDKDTSLPQPGPTKSAEPIWVWVLMPQLGESVTEGIVTRWLKKEGEYVHINEPLVEVSTDKVDTEIPSPGTGFLRNIAVDEDETVAVGATLAVITEE